MKHREVASISKLQHSTSWKGMKKTITNGKRFQIICQKVQRRQSGLKSEGSWARVKKFRFSRKISEKFRFFQAISQTKNRFLGKISEKFRFFPGNFTKYFDFSS